MDSSSTIISEITGQMQEINEARDHDWWSDPKGLLPNIVNLNNNLNEGQKNTASLKKEILDMRSYRENITHQKDFIRKQIVEAIAMTVKMTKNLTKMETLFTSKETKVRTAKEALLNQCEVSMSSIRKLKHVQLLEEKQEKSRNQIENFNKRLEEFKKADKIFLSEFKAVEEEMEKLEGKLQQKQECLNKNLKMSKDLDISYGIQVKENKKNTLKRAIKNQQNFNKDLKRKRN